MQTFLPIATTNFLEIARVLDNKRLNKQALEAWQILLTNLKLDPAGGYREPKGWYNHPATKMWRGHESALLNYIGAMVTEWKFRGYKSTIFDKAERTFDRALELDLVTDIHPVLNPPWMDEQDKYEAIASTHRLALLVKEYEWYSQFGWAEDTGTAPSTYEYIWE